jgi:hypothetical protein
VSGKKVSEKGVRNLFANGVLGKRSTARCKKVPDTFF